MEKKTGDAANVKPEQVTFNIIKYQSQDFKVIAFSIPRSELANRKQFNEKELDELRKNNCIYILAGNSENGKEMYYVGKAGKRTDGAKSALDRLYEHHNSTSEPYRSLWSKILVFTSEGTDKEEEWGVNDIAALEYFLYEEFPKDRLWNRMVPNSGGAEKSRYASKIKQIKTYAQLAKLDNFKETKDVENISKVEIGDTQGKLTVVNISRSDNGVSEYTTPAPVVKKLLDRLPDSVWNYETKFIDIACKGGEFLKEIYDRLMSDDGMKARYKNEDERAIHILCEQLYGLALSEKSFNATKKKLMTFGYNVKIMSNYELNIVKGKFRFGAKQDGKQKTINDVINEAFGEEMNFNVIVGNPPYSNSVGGGTGDQGATALFNEFMNAAIDMAEYSKEDCVISMITPTKWIAGLGDKNIVAARKRMIEGNHLRYFVDYLDSRNCFRGVSIAGGVSYWLWDKNYNGLTKWTTVNNSYESEAVERDLKEFDIIHRIPLADSIIEKVQAKSTDYMDRYISRNEWGYGTNCWYQYDYPKKRKNETDIRLVTRQGNLYIPKKRIMAEDIYYKVIFSRAVADATALPNDKGKYRILTSIQILKPGEIASASYMGVTKINLYEGACNIKKYFETKFVRFLILLSRGRLW